MQAEARRQDLTSDMKTLTIGKLAHASGVNLETIRFYERLGLLPKPPRTASGYRLFPLESARRVRFIKRAQALGFTLKQIRELLGLRVSPKTDSEVVRERAQAKLVDIDQKIRSLQAMRQALTRLAESCTGRDAAGECPILESLNPDSDEP